MARKLQIAVLLIAALSVLYFLNVGKGGGGDRLEIKIGEVRVYAHTSDSPEEQEIGLSQFRGLRQDEGMLFIFEQPDFHYFWMKDMKFPLDIIWLDEGKTVVHIEENVSPETYPDSFVSGDPALYVLEVPAGFSAKNDIAVGDLAEW